MTDTMQWHQANDAYLTAALEWLRARLVWLAQADPPPLSPASRTVPRGPWFRRGGREDAIVPPPQAGDRDVRQAAEAMQAAAAAVSPSPALALVGDRLGLSLFEREVLLLCAGMEIDPTLAELCARASGLPHPTFALAMVLFDNPSWDVLSPERPLRYWRLIEITQPGAQPLTTSPLRADERIANALKGLHYLDDRLHPLLVPMNGNGVPVPASHQAIIDATVSRTRRSRRSRPFPVINLVGSDGPTLRALARGIASALEVPLYRLPLENIPSQHADLETLARLWQREYLLAPVALYVDARDLDDKSAGASALTRVLDRVDGLVLVGTRHVWNETARGVTSVEVAKPTRAEQCAVWEQQVAAAGIEAGAVETLQELPQQFNLDVETIQRVAREVLEEGPHDLGDRLWAACRRAARPRLDSLATRIEARAGWERLVLPQPELRLLRQIADQVAVRSRVYQDWGFGEMMSRGLGISALFAGESGTGKTLAAEVLARELRLDLYRIDLSSVVNKYIGETEKNLARLFDAAEDGGIILFFDEADALFGKRSEVKDAHDRYANIEINYLLQRMEAYRGLAILATNMKSALDPAFTRRLRFTITFAFPGVAERRQMWAHAFPASTPTRALDFDRLARLNLTGAGIHSAAVNAAFAAARTGGPVTMREVLDSVRLEFRKLERPVNENDLRWEPQAVLA